MVEVIKKAGEKFQDVFERAYEPVKKYYNKTYGKQTKERKYAYISNMVEGGIFSGIGGALTVVMLDRMIKSSYTPIELCLFLPLATICDFMGTLHFVDAAKLVDKWLKELESANNKVKELSDDL
jgi:hypothetical protein